MEIEKPRRRKRAHPKEFKQAVIAACCEPDTSVAGIALANGINANQVRRWMREQGIEPPSLSLPVSSISAERYRTRVCANTDSTHRLGYTRYSDRSATWQHSGEDRMARTDGE